MKTLYSLIVVLLLASSASAADYLVDSDGTRWRAASPSDSDQNWWFSINKGLTYFRSQTPPPKDAAIEKIKTQEVTEKKAFKRCGCPPGQQCQCNVDKIDPPSSMPDDAFAWVPISGKPDQIALMNDGVQVGAFRYSDLTYRPYKDGVWGEPAVPPYPLPAKKAEPRQESFAPAHETKVPKHTVDEYGNWWRMPDIDDDDQRQLFSLDNGKTWKRTERPKTVRVVTPVVCRCPATGNKEKSEGPNNCLCHDKKEQCGCHTKAEGGGTVFQELALTSPQASSPQPRVWVPAAPPMVRSAPMVQSGAACST